MDPATPKGEMVASETSLHKTCTFLEHSAWPAANMHVRACFFLLFFWCVCRLEICSFFSCGKKTAAVCCPQCTCKVLNAY